MGRFLKVQGEPVWINLDRIEGLMVRPVLKAVGAGNGGGNLEERHESTGYFELVVMVRGQLVNVETYSSRELAETRVEALLAGQLVE